VQIVDVFLKTVREVNPMRNAQIVPRKNVVAKKGLVSDLYFHMIFLDF
jgi:hypothetical protein